MIQNSILITKALSYLVFIISFLFQNDAHSSTTDDFDSLRIVHSYHQIDVIDLIKSIRNGDKKSDTTHYKPYKIYSTAIVTFGYSLNTNFSASFSTCFASHFGNPNQVNLSTLEFTPSITAYKQFIVPIQSNIFTRNNNYNITGSWIFFKYPQNTYGLGGFTQLKDAVMMDYKLILIRQLVMRKLFNALYAGVGYALDYHWNIKELNESASETDFDRYGKVKSSCSSGVISTLQFDNRKNPLNAKQGFYCNIQFRQNLKGIGSNSNWNSILMDTRKYFPIPHSKNIIAFWLYVWVVTNGKPPYLDLPSSTWDKYGNQGRGYIQSRFRGNDLFSIEAEYRYQILKNGLIGGVIFANVQSVNNYSNNSITKFWPALGIGLRLKFNKSSDTNLAVDYAVGKGNSHGLFVNLGEFF